MKIAFWSNVHGQTATTSNLIIIGLLATLEHKHSNLITQSHFNLNNLEAALMGNLPVDSVEIFEDIGLDALARNMKTGVLEKETFTNCSLSYLNEKLHLLPGTTKNNKNIYEVDMLNTVSNILNAADSFYDCVFVDTSSGNNALTTAILESSDKIVVNLCQNKFVLNDFFQNCVEKYRDKMVFLLGNYNQNSRFNKRNIQNIYNLSSEEIGVIPYNVEFLDAQSEGEVIRFLLRNQSCTREDSNYYFINEAKRATNMILNKKGKVKC